MPSFFRLRSLMCARTMLTASSVIFSLRVVALGLDRPLDLLRLAMACKRYRPMTVLAIDDSGGEAGEGAQAGPPEMRSITEEVARRWVVACPDSHQNYVLGRQNNWLGSAITLGATSVMALKPPLEWSRAARTVAAAAASRSAGMSRSAAVACRRLRSAHSCRLAGPAA